MKKIIKIPPIICLLWLLILTLHLFLLINFKFTVWPEVVLYPYLMGKGFKLYQDIINPYFPGLQFLTFSYFQVVGLTVSNLKLLTWGIILTTNLVIFICSYLLSKSWTKALFSSLIYVLLNLGYGGNGLWFELILTPFVLLSLVFSFSQSNKKRNLLLSGLMITLGIFIKQNAILFLIPLIFYLLASKNDHKMKGVFYLLMPIVLVGGLTILWLFNQNLQTDFFNWAIRLPMIFSTQPGFALWPTKKQLLFIFLPVILSFWSIWICKWQIRQKIFWLLSILIAFLFCFPRYEDFHAQVLVGLSAVLLRTLQFRSQLIALFVVLIVFWVKEVPNWHQPDRFLDQDSQMVASQISKFSSVYLLNAPELSYYLADKAPPKPWATNFPWYFESNNFEDKFIQSFAEQNIEYIVIGDRIGGSKYNLGNYIPEKLNDYIQRNYQPLYRFNQFQVWQRLNSP